MRKALKKVLSYPRRALGTASLAVQAEDNSKQIADLKRQIFELHEFIDQKLNQIDTHLLYNTNLQKVTADISKVPYKQGTAGIIRNGNLRLLQDVVKILTDLNIEYFLDYGTLLGAIRHGGPIPWDDDIDITIKREDYDRLLKNIKRKQSNIHFVHSEIIRVFYLNTPLQVDIFPLDFCDRQLSHADRKHFIEHIKKTQNDYLHFDYSKLFTQECVLISPSYAEINKIRHKEICREVNFAEAQANNYPAYHSLEATSGHHVLDFGWIFPLRQANYMGVNFYIPNNPDAVLRTYYGDYWEFPQDISPKHDDITARISETTLQLVKEYIGKEGES